MENATTESLPFAPSSSTLNVTEAGGGNGTEADAGTVSRQQLEVCRMYRFVFSVVLVGGLCIVGIVGNLLALVVLRHYREKSSISAARSPTALILSALAVMDTLVLASLLLVKSLPSLFYFSGTGQRYLAISPYLWQWGWPLNDLFHAYSTWITVLVALQRCVAVSAPHRAATLCSYSLTWGLIFSLLVAVTLFQLPTFLDYRLVEMQDAANNTGLRRVFTDIGRSEIYQIAYKTTAYYLVIYIIPLILLAIFSVILVSELRRAKAVRSDMAHGGPASKEDDVTKSLLLVVLVCMLCQPWEPVRRVMEAQLMQQPGCGHFYFYYEEFPSLSFAINSSVNFIIYFMSGTKFRLGLRNVLACSGTAETEDSGTSSASFGGQATMGKPGRHGGSSETEISAVSRSNL